MIEPIINLKIIGPISGRILIGSGYNSPKVLSNTSDNKVALLGQYWRMWISSSSSLSSY